MQGSRVGSSVEGEKLEAEILDENGAAADVLEIDFVEAEGEERIHDGV